MRKSILLLCAIMLLCFCLAPLAQATSDVWVLRAVATVYAAADTSSRVVATAQPGQRYEIIDSTEKNRFIQVQYSDAQFGNTVIGWIKEDVLDEPSFVYEASIFDETCKYQDDRQEASDGDIGIVLCQALSFRERPESSAHAFAGVAQEAKLEILGKQGTWLYARYCVPEMDVTGWVNSAYVVINPQYYTTTKQTAAYAYPDMNANRVGLIDRGEVLLIIHELEYFYVVSLRGASAFIRKQ